MGTKVINIKREGLEAHINRYFQERGKKYTYTYVLRLKNMQIGKKHISIQQQADALEIPTRSTLYGWHRLINQD